MTLTINRFQTNFEASEGTRSGLLFLLHFRCYKVNLFIKIKRTNSGQVLFLFYSQGNQTRRGIALEKATIWNEQGECAEKPD